MAQQLAPRQNFQFYDGPEAFPEQPRLGGPTPGNSLRTQQNFTMGGQPPPAASGFTDGVTDVRAKTAPLNSPQAQAWQAERAAMPQPAQAGAQNPNSFRNMFSQRAGEFVDDVRGMTNGPVQPQGAVRRAAGIAGKGLGAITAAGLEGMNVAEVVRNPDATNLDVASQAAQGVGRLGGAYLGGKAGASLGAAGGSFLGPVGTVAGGLIGGIAGGAAGYYGADKAIEAGRSLAGVDPASPQQQLANPAAPAAPMARGPASGGGNGLRMDGFTDPRSTIYAGSGPAAAPAAPQDFTQALSTVPRDLPAGLQDGAIYKTKGANGETVYSGRNVGNNASMIDGKGNSLAMGGGVTVLPAGATMGNSGLDARVDAARQAAAARGDFDAVAQSYGRAGFNGVVPDAPGSANSLRKQALAYSQTPGWSRSRFQAMMQSANQADQNQQASADRRYTADSSSAATRYSADQHAAATKATNDRNDLKMRLDYQQHQQTLGETKRQNDLQEGNRQFDRSQRAETQLDKNLDVTMIGPDGKPDAQKKAAFKTELDAYVGQLADAAERDGKTASAKSLREQGFQALGKDDLEKAKRAFELKEKARETNSNFNPVGTTFRDTGLAGYMDVKPKKNMVLPDQYQTANGTVLPKYLVDRDGAGNSLTQRLYAPTDRYDMLKNNSLRSK